MQSLLRRISWVNSIWFVDFVYDLLNATDILLTKCGASTIMEILMYEKIPVIIDYLWEQELGIWNLVSEIQLEFWTEYCKTSHIIKRFNFQRSARQKIPSEYWTNVGCANGNNRSWRIFIDCIPSKRNSVIARPFFVEASFIISIGKQDRRVALPLAMTMICFF